MKAVCVRNPGGVEELYLGEVEKPVPGDGELLVRARASALNRADILQREGKYPPPEGASPVLGLEVAGTVDVVGPHCEPWAVGDRVMALLSGGGYAEYVAVPAAMAMRIPEALSFEEAAGIPEVFLTAYQALHWIGHLEQDESVLIHAGASGVGTAALQLAKAAGAHPFATASGPKLDACRALGAEAAINYREESFPARIEALTAGRGVDLILDFIGAPYLDQNLAALALDGRLVLLATLGGSRVEALDLRALMRKRVQLTATTLRSRSAAYKAALTEAFAAYALPLFEVGILQPVIDRVYAWEDVGQAHRRMEANENIGKLVLRIS